MALRCDVRSRSPPKNDPEVAVIEYCEEEWQDSQPDPTTLPDHDLDFHLKIVDL